MISTIGGLCVINTPFKISTMFILQEKVIYFHRIFMMIIYNNNMDDGMESVFCKGDITISTNNFLWIVMGSGVGYFIIGKVFIHNIYTKCKERYTTNQNEEVVLAHQV
tara:strand:- start:482 stop:805 length:324 start_codon:yes stop_codon:yes gene_type:complete